MPYDKDILVEKAKEFAHEAHDFILQKRKYTGAPYWVHTDEVAAIVSTVTNDPEVIAAAHLHDVVEDVNIEPYTAQTIYDLFGSRVANLVIELTNRYTKENVPTMNRSIRKLREAERLAKISYDAQTIKYADIIANTSDISKSDPKFAPKYLSEKREILKVMTGGHPVLFGRASAQVFQKND